jgi:hypothetical protein
MPNRGYTAFHDIAEKCVIDSTTFLLRHAAESLLFNNGLVQLFLHRHVIAWLLDSLFGTLTVPLTCCSVENIMPRKQIFLLSLIPSAAPAVEETRSVSCD